VVGRVQGVREVAGREAAEVGAEVEMVKEEEGRVGGVGREVD
jgi:hypothetical protein